MKKIENWNNGSIKVIELRKNGNRTLFINLGDIININNCPHKIIALDNEEHVFKAINMKNNEEVTMYAYEII